MFDNARGAAEGEAVARHRCCGPDTSGHTVSLVKQFVNPSQDAARLKPGQHAEPARRQLAARLRRPAQLHRVRLRPGTCCSTARSARTCRTSAPTWRRGAPRRPGARRSSPSRRASGAVERRRELERRDRGRLLAGARRRLVLVAGAGRDGAPSRAFRRRSRRTPPVRTSPCRRSTARALCSARRPRSRSERPQHAQAPRARPRDARRCCCAGCRARSSCARAAPAPTAARARQVHRTARLAELRAAAAERVGCAGRLARDRLAGARLARRLGLDADQHARAAGERALARHRHGLAAAARHAGRLVAYSQGNGASFVPAKPFTQGERVSVHAQLRDGATTIALRLELHRGRAGSRRRRRRQPAPGAAEGRLPELSLAPGPAAADGDGHRARRRRDAGRHLHRAVLRARASTGR